MMVMMMIIYFFTAPYMQRSILSVCTNLCRNVQLNSDQRTSEVLHGQIFACLQTDVAKLHPITI
jgi:hypothetical protein